jgi:hypothetical protein
MTCRPLLPGISTSTWIRREQKAAITSAEFSPTAGAAPLPKGKEATSAQTGDVPRSITFSATAVSVSGLSFTDARYVTEAGGFQLAGTAGALSDHAVVLAWVQRK